MTIFYELDPLFDDPDGYLWVLKEGRIWREDGQKVGRWDLSFHRTLSSVQIRKQQLEDANRGEEEK